MIQTVKKRDGRIVGFNEQKIAAAIRKAMLARAEVLTVEGDRGLRERGADVIGEVLEIEARGRTCDGLRAEAVDARLDEDVRSRTAFP